MTPPEASVNDPTGQRAETAPAVSACPPYTIATLQKRADFLRAASARRQGMAAALLQARQRDDANLPPDLLRVGYTCSKKVGNAVARNRAKRRLRAIARLVLPHHGRPGWDYVLIGRADVTATYDFAAMQADLIRAIERVHSDDYRPPARKSSSRHNAKGPRKGPAK
ncbi:ribonuclease P protein component [Rhodobacteraceae bacterium]|nr:ribonuclease P protein component [Paracoccaceae bacterium]